MILGPGSSMINLNKHGEGLSANSAALAIVSTIIGGGIVGLPYAMLLLGFVVGIFTNLVFCFITAMSGLIFLKLRENIPGKPNSLFEIGYMLQGRKSIFLVAGTQIFFSFGLMIIYFIVFGDTAAQVVGGFTNTLLGESWYCSRWFYVVIVAAALAPVCAQKELAELEWLSLLLAGSLVLFVLMSVILLCIPSFPSTAPTFNSLIWPDKRFITIESFCTIMVAYSYQQNVFPVYDSLKTKS